MESGKEENFKNKLKDVESHVLSSDTSSLSKFKLLASNAFTSLFLTHRSLFILLRTLLPLALIISLIFILNPVQAASCNTTALETLTTSLGGTSGFLQLEDLSTTYNLGDNTETILTDTAFYF